MPADRPVPDDHRADGSGSAGEADAALAGIRVVDFANGLAGPLASMVLGDLGADVVKVEAIDGGDLTRDLTPQMFLAANRNKRSIALNVKDPRGRAVAQRLIAGADVVVESFRPGIMDGLGLGASAMMDLNPRLVYASFSGFGATGANASRRSVDAVAQAESGMIVANEGAEAPFTLVDTSAGFLLAQGVLAALVKRARTGRGERVEATLLATALYLQSVQFADFSLTGAVLTPSERARRAPTAGLFHAADGLIYVAAHYEEHWQLLCEVLGVPDLPHDPRFAARASRVEHGAELRDVLAARFATRPRADWFGALGAKGVMVAIVKTYDEVLREQDESTSSWMLRGTTPEGAPLTLVAAPFRIGGRGSDLRSSPPVLGSGSRSVLAELGYPDDEVDRLVEERVVATGDDEARAPAGAGSTEG